MTNILQLQNEYVADKFKRWLFEIGVLSLFQERSLAAIYFSRNSNRKRDIAPHSILPVSAHPLHY